MFKKSQSRSATISRILWGNRHHYQIHLERIDHILYDKASEKNNGTAISCKSRLCGAVPHSGHGSFFIFLRAVPRETRPYGGPHADETAQSSSACGKRG